MYTSKIEFKVETDQPTLVFVPVNYHEYWRAKVNSETAVIYPANYAFMAIRVEAGASEVKFEFINTKLTVNAAILIILGLLSVYAGIMRVKSGWQKLMLITCGVLLIGKSLMSIPGIMNTDIPERPAIHSDK